MKTKKIIAGVVVGGILLIVVVPLVVEKSMESTDWVINTGGHKTTSEQNSPHKSARQLITDRAKEQYGRNVDVMIDSGFAGGAYTVTISDHDKFHTYTYTVTVDESAQEITSWKLTAND